MVCKVLPKPISSAKMQLVPRSCMLINQLTPCSWYGRSRPRSTKEGVDVMVVRGEAVVEEEDGEDGEDEEDEEEEARFFRFLWWFCDVSNAFIMGAETNGRNASLSWNR